MELHFRKKSIIFTILCSIPIFYQLSSIKDLNLEYIQYIPLFVIFSIGLILSKNKFSINAIFLFFIPVLVNYLIFPLISFNIGNMNLNIEILNIILQVFFLITILIVTTFIKQNKDLRVLINSLLIGNTIILTIVILLNFEEMININNYVWLLSERADRATYGFYHSNTAGLFIYTQLILISASYVLNERKVLCIPFLFYFIALLPTGSRTALISFVFLVIIYFFLRFLCQFNVNIKLLLLIILMLIIGVTLTNLNWTLFWNNTSNRGQYYLHNIKYIIDSGNLLFGIGPVNYTNMSNFNSNILITDNWYLANTILYGILGTVIFVIFTLLLLIKTLRLSLLENNKLLTFTVAFFISILSYSFFETILYVPGVLLSFVFWVLIFSVINVNSKKSEQYNITEV